MLKIGLTGSIGMGKTETGKIFSELGFPLYDADAAVHKLYGPGQKGSEKIKEKFPNSINPDGSVNRESLSAEVLADPEKIKSLESIIHPLVGEDREVFFKKNAKAKAIVLDIPLLFETGGEKYVDVSVVVTATAKTQMDRVVTQRKIPLDVFKSIQGQQMPDQEKLKKADYIISTECDISDTEKEVRDVVSKIKLIQPKAWSKFHSSS